MDAVLVARMKRAYPHCPAGYWPGCGRVPPDGIVRLPEQIKECQNCYHFHEFGRCSCRETIDVIQAAGKCPDWQPC